MIVRLVAQGNLLRTLPPKRFPVSVLVHGGGISHRNSVLTTFQSAAKPDQIVCKTTMPTMVASRIRASQIETDSAVRRLGGEIESSLFFPACFSASRI